MEGKRQALILWLQAVTEQEVIEINELRNGRLIEHLLSKIEGFSFESSSQGTQSWKVNYNKLKSIYEQLNTFLQKNSKMALPQELTYMNLIEMSQGKSEQSLQTLLHLVFIVCIQSSIRSEVVPCIMRFPSSAQNELMMIIKESTLQREEEDQRQSEINDYKQAITKLEYAYNTLVQENQSLRANLFEDQERSLKNEELVRKLQKENQSLNRELFEKNQMLIRHREELMLDKYGAMNEELVEDLKRELLEREQQYGQQIMTLNETITSLRDEIAQIKKSNLQLIEEQTNRSMIQNRASDHTNCIAIEKHKAKINEMLAISKEATQKEMTVKIQNIKLKNQNAELESKLKKLNEELHKKNNDFMLTKEDSSKLKIEFFSRIRDSLKEKLEEFKLKNEANVKGCAQFLQNEV